MLSEAFPFPALHLRNEDGRCLPEGRSGGVGYLQLYFDPVWGRPLMGPRDSWTPYLSLAEFFHLHLIWFPWNLAGYCYLFFCIHFSLFVA